MSSKFDLNKFKDVVEQVKSAQKQFQSLVNKETIKEARKYAEASAKDLKQFIKTTDMKKVKAMIEREAKDLQTFQKKLPKELAKFSKFVDGQKKELEKILRNVGIPTTKGVSKSKTVLSKKSKKSTAAASSGLSEGAVAPDFALVSDSGDTVKLSSLKGKAVVLYFYPKDDTPGCTKESCDFRDYQKDFSAENALIFGISRDDQASHQKFKAKFNLPFPLLVDADGEACQAYGVWQEKSMYGKTFMGIVRTTFIINAQGKVAKIYPKVSVDGHVEQVLADLKALKNE